MTPFLDLPDEIQLAVISFVDPEDLLKFSYTSRKIQGLCQDAIAQHVELKQRFEEIQLDRHHHPLNILHAIRDNPDLALYIKHIHYHGTCDEWQNLLAFELPEGELKFGRHASHVKSVQWPSWDLTDFMPELRPQFASRSIKFIWNLWKMMLDRGLPSAYLLLLILHLPRLKRLRMTAVDMCDQTFVAVLRAWRDYTDMFKDDQSHQTFNTPDRVFSDHGQIYIYKPPPPSLEVVEAYHSGDEASAFNFDHLQVFTYLPTVHTIRGKNISSNPSPFSEPHLDPVLTTQPPPPIPALPSTLPSNLTTLELTDSSLAPPTLSLLLPHCPHLHTYRQTHSSPSEPWLDLPHLITVLLTTHHNKIQHLSLIHPYFYGSTPQIPSFVPFVRLKTLEVSLATLLPHSTWPEKEAHLMAGGPVPSLSDVLPHSCVEVTLGVEIAPGALSESGLLRGWPKRQVFPLGLRGEILPGQQRWGWEVLGAGGGGSPFGGRAGLGFGGVGPGAGAVAGPALGRGGSSWSSGGMAGLGRREQGSVTGRGGTGTGRAEVPLVNPLLTRLRKIRYFCCPTQVVKCNCIDAEILCEYEEGAYLSLEITRKQMKGWGGAHEEVWERESGEWEFES
ncbi:hypothetical protein B9Z65_6147 [Elsinoe australis]|uniref:F-box domain-containing protein n=1 Tax=Elsinoe australis TaxID=40998 RepID=A0A2P8A7U3_9PEZI|nr:hypothetical protein B9Z65_6147 [Elsinoe australis]